MIIDYVKNFEKILTKEEINNLVIYTDVSGEPNFKEINRKTRNGEELNEKEKRLFESNNKVLNSFSMLINTVLYRCFSINDLKNCDMFDEKGKPKIGSILTFKSLTSTSFSITSSFDYIKVNEKSFNILCKIDCKKGIKGLCLIEFSDKLDDYEFLLPYGTKYFIKNALQKENNTFIFEIEII